MRTPSGLASVLLSCALVGCGGGGDGSPDAGGGPDASGDATPDAPVIGEQQCDNAWVSPAGSCEVTAGAGSAVRVRGDVLLPTGALRDGEVIYDGSEIVCVGCDCSDHATAATATTVTCADAAVSPGLINAHDHLNFNNGAPLPSTAPGGARFQHRHDWRGAAPTPSNQYGTGANDAGMRLNEFRQLFAGTTSIAGSTMAVGLARNLDELETRDRDLGLGALVYETFILGDGGETFRPDCTWNYKYSEYEVSLFDGLVTHTAEGINTYANEEYRCQRDSMVGEDFVEANVGHIHGIGLSTDDYYDLAESGASLIWSPRSNIALYGMTAQVTLLARLGGHIALGTDWTYSGSATVPRELACAQALSTSAYDGAFSAADLWGMSTHGAARATGTAAQLGTLAPGMIADLAVFRGDGALYQQAIDALSDDVLLVTRAGAPMFGQADVIAALADDCEAIDVCGEARQVCAARELGGATWASVAAATPAAYPAILCAVPDDEPTCVPSRPAAYAGPTADDSDGDGAVDASDNCPRVFNPTRPIDGGAQPDRDGDSMGDACDPTPLPADLDGDGATNEADNCPLVDNTPQADQDGDGKGDTCDACVAQANPDSVCGPAATSIVDIQNGTVAEGAAVMIEGAAVTAIDARGFVMQDPTVADGQYAGIYVFIGSRPDLALGDRVTVGGTVDEYFELTELANGSIITRAAGTPLTPIAVSVATAATEPYEGVLVQVADVTSVVNPYDCAVDGAACADPLLFEINGAIVVGNPFFDGNDATWTAEATAIAGSADPTIVGVMTFRFARRRMGPRMAADLTP